jgi:hypothetical protein
MTTIIKSDALSISLTTITPADIPFIFARKMKLLQKIKTNYSI